MAGKTSAKASKDSTTAKTSVTPVKVSTTSVGTSSAGRLHVWNKWLAVIFAVQGLLILILSTSKMFPITLNYPATDTLQTQAQGHAVLATGSTHLFDVNLAFVVAAFLFVAAIMYGLMATKLRATQERDLAQRINRLRWLTFALASGVMAVVVGMVVGMQDASTLLVLFGLTALANLFCLAVETRSSGKNDQRWLNYLIAGISGLLPWVVIVAYLVGGVVDGTVPGYAWWVAGTMFVLFAGFVANAYAQHRKIGRWADYLYGERNFMLLILVAQTVLAWLIFAEILHP